MIKKSFYYHSDLLSEQIRKKKMGNIQRTIEEFSEMEKKWIEEESKKGNDPDKDMAVRVVRMLLMTNRNWVESEKELFELEELFRSLIKTEVTKTTRRAKLQ